MLFLQVLAIFYLTIGFLYALYILLFGSDKWYSFFINMLLGPLTLLYVAYVNYFDKKPPFYD